MHRRRPTSGWPLTVKYRNRIEEGEDSILTVQRARHGRFRCFPRTVRRLTVAEARESATFPAMSEVPLQVLAVVGSLRERSVTRIVLEHVVERLRARGAAVDLLDLSLEPLPLYNPDTAYDHPAFPPLQARVEHADVYLLGTPDYHGSISSPLKNFLDHFWREFAGKLFAPLVASHEKGLTAIDQLRTVARQCYAWSLPYGVSFLEDDVGEDVVLNPKLVQRLEMFEHDARVYGSLLARQRRADLAGVDPGFLARYRK